MLPLLMMLPELLAAHQRRGMFHPEHHAAQEDRHRGVETTGVESLDAAGLRRAAGIVEQAVEPAETALRRRDQGLHLRFVGHIGPLEDAGWSETGGERLAFGGAAPGGHDLRPLGNEDLRRPQADTARRTRDHRNLAVEPSHVVLPRLLRPAGLIGASGPIGQPAVAVTMLTSGRAALKDIAWILHCAAPPGQNLGSACSSPVSSICSVRPSVSPPSNFSRRPAASSSCHRRPAAASRPIIRATARRHGAIASQVIEAFADCDYVVAPSGSCAGMMSKHYPELFADDPNLVARANAFAGKTYELVSFLTDIRGVTAVDAAFAGAVTYHDSCSGLRELGIQAQPRRLLSTVRGLDLVEMTDSDVCCGFGGTFAVKYGEISNSIVEKKTESVAASGAPVLLAGDLGCLMNMAGKLSRQGSAVEVRHIAEVLAGMTDTPPIGAPAGKTAAV